MFKLDELIKDYYLVVFSRRYGGGRWRFGSGRNWLMVGVDVGRSWCWLMVSVFSFVMFNDFLNLVQNLGIVDGYVDEGGRGWRLMVVVVGSW